MQIVRKNKGALTRDEASRFTSKRESLALFCFFEEEVLILE